MLDNWFRELTAPIREIKSKIMGVKNLKDGLQGDVKRIKREVGLGGNNQQPPPKPPEPKK